MSTYERRGESIAGSCIIATSDLGTKSSNTPRLIEQNVCRQGFFTFDVNVQVRTG